MCVSLYCNMAQVDVPHSSWVTDRWTTPACYLCHTYDAIWEASVRIDKWSSWSRWVDDCMGTSSLNKRSQLKRGQGHIPRPPPADTVYHPPFSISKMWSKCLHGSRRSYTLTTLKTPTVLYVLYLISIKPKSGVTVCWTSLQQNMENTNVYRLI